MTTDVWFEIWNITNTPYKVNPTKLGYPSEMDAELAIPLFEQPRPNEPADIYEIRQVVTTVTAVNTITVEPRAIKSVEEIADDAIDNAMYSVRFDIHETEDYDLLSKEDQQRVNDLFNEGADCCNTCGQYVLTEELDEDGNCDDCVAELEEDEDFEEED